MQPSDVQEIARNAVMELKEQLGDDAVFPYDAIWAYAKTEVPSRQRPGPQRYLVSHGYIEPTGGVATASTSARAGSPTKEYRLGKRFRAVDLGMIAMSDSSDQLISEQLKAIESAMVERGFIIHADQLANFYLALQVSPLVIFAGISGTGKSRLPRLFTQLISGEFSSISVQPQWSDNSDLFGYTPTLFPERFVRGKFTEAVLGALRDPDRVSVVLLDEMNLAPVEHYFSDFLSVVESRERIGDTVVMDRLPLDLPREPETGPDPNLELRELRLPYNMRIVGTANMDETTRPFSPKVIDRAFCIDFDVIDIDLTDFPVKGAPGIGTTSFAALTHRLTDQSTPLSVHEVYNTSSELFDYIASLLKEIQEILTPAGISFAYRLRDQICLYMWHWRNDGLSTILPARAALDFCILQKVLPKIGGTGELMRLALENLLAWLNHDEGASPPEDLPTAPYARSARKVAQMLHRLEADGVTSYWTT